MDDLETRRVKIEEQRRQRSAEGRARAAERIAAKTRDEDE